jgi:AGCS family alanine or glycine:cation symporter
MELLERIVNAVNYWVWEFGVPARGEVIPLAVIALLGTGVFLTIRLRFIQLRRLGHGFAVTSGKYDDPDEPGDVPHFQALTTALSATVGIGNIAGVAIAIHWGGPGALFWMWVTAFLGMATKFTEVTLAQHYRHVEEPTGDRLVGTVSGGPMYYIERGLGPLFKPLAVFFAIMLGFTAFLTGNAVQANTVADSLLSTFGIPVWISGLATATVVALVVLGGIRRIGRVTSVLAPFMAAVYVVGALTIILLHFEWFVPAVTQIFVEAFNPSAGVAGTGIGALLLTMMWGVRRGLFSNEAGQGSAPIAHAAAKTDEPVSEGVVALLEPFIDTLVICTMTGLVIVMTGVWKERVPTEIQFAGAGDLSYVEYSLEGRRATVTPTDDIRIENGMHVVTGPGAPLVAWHEVELEQLFVDADHTIPFTGVIVPRADNGVGVAIADDGTRYDALYAAAVESGAPLTMLGFERGLPGRWGDFIVLLSVLLFAVSTAISWSYYGDRCANYLFGPRAILPYKTVFVLMHFFGALVSLNAIWLMGDVALGIVILPNLLGLILLSGKVKQLTDSYFERKPWLENLEVHKRVKAERHSSR